MRIIALSNLARIGRGEAELACVHSGRVQRVGCEVVVPVTMRIPQDDLFHALCALGRERPDAMPKTLRRIGDCLAPGTIAAAVYGGHRYARELGEPAPEGVPFRRELPRLADD